MLIIHIITATYSKQAKYALIKLMNACGFIHILIHNFGCFNKVDVNQPCV